MKVPLTSFPCGICVLTVSECILVHPKVIDIALNLRDPEVAIRRGTRPTRPDSEHCVVQESISYLSKDCLVFSD